MNQEIENRLREYLGDRAYQCGYRWPIEWTSQHQAIALALLELNRIATALEELVAHKDEGR